MLLAFLLPFGCRHLLLGRPVPAAGIRFPHGPPTSEIIPLNHDGVSMFRTAEMRPVSGASFTPGPWCSHGCHLNSSHHCRLPAAGPFPRYCFHLPEFWLTKLTEVHSRSPFPVFPLPVTSGWNTGPWAFSRASHPAVTSDACQERERALSTRPELTADQSTLHSSYLTQQCDLMSHPDAPVVAGRLQRHHLDPVAGERRPSAVTAVTGPSPSRPRFAGPGPGIRPGCRMHTIPDALATSIAATRPAQHPLVLLVVDNLRFRLAHRGHLLSLS